MHWIFLNEYMIDSLLYRQKCIIVFLKCLCFALFQKQITTTHNAMPLCGNIGYGNVSSVCMWVETKHRNVVETLDWFIHFRICSFSHDFGRWFWMLQCSLHWSIQNECDKKQWDLNTPTACRSFSLTVGTLNQKCRETRMMKIEKTKRARAFAQHLLGVVSRPPLWGINGKWIQRLLCFTCCNVTPKNTKLLSNSCSSLYYLTHYYIIPTGCVPDSPWLPANLFCVCLSPFFFFF